MTRSLKITLLGSASALLLGAAAAADCPPVTAANMGGLTSAYPQQFELAEFQQAANCTLELAENPEIAALNARIMGNGDLPPLAERLPSEPLVVAPYTAIGNYGGTLMGTSRATESGTSDLLSVRHVNLVRYSDDLQTLVPNVAREWAWNDSFTELTFHLRADHKWSDGTPFTAEDIVFWYEDLILNTNVYTETPGRWLFAGEPAQVEAVDATTVKFTFPVPVPGLLNRFAVDYGQPFQPKHFLGQFMDKHNPDAAARRAELGFESEGDAVNFFYGPSDWKDIPTPLLRDATKLDAIGRAVVPTLESHIVVEDNSEGRRLVANPYFHMVDTAGNQLPYINEISETYVPEREVNMLRMLDGQVHWKQQAVFLDDFPVLKENEANANITVGLAPAPGSMTYYSFNRGHKDPVLRDVFGDPRFSVAMSHAMNRDEINEIVFLGQGRPANALPVEPVTVGFVTEEQVTRNTAYDVERANALLDEMGLEMGADGVRLLPDGRPFVLRLTYASQGGPVQMHELVRDYWGAVGVRVDLREVSSDEYRATANANDADILSWKNDGVSAPAFSQDPRSAFPPFGDFFNPGPGIAWDEWKKTDGASGVEPPEDVLRLWDLAERLTQIPLGTPESDAIGSEIVEIHLDQMIRIGTVGDIPEPYMHSNLLQNVPVLKAKTYDYYWTYPYRPQQWFLAN
ncbi:MAG: peptide/nickel transport system substrate-binding protein [Roseibaca calidilacus]|uniref:Peptide/nickel transport system substrate-binding protein n=1 Tax=Roseibaca calidilacus TaxID=1666912 RepID=A0A0N8K7W2_9RHOB|nr:ABC transporter substrate-binding protein [Roseibaca calidilacus]KPP92849.1 MAG: peptide/nickel transport system substrate-binding protein [Roseibaca calidilacus]CUX80079.1 peptide/nickel transport system substrate-binding protein [Roseibaca calidilacus]